MRLSLSMTLLVLAASAAAGCRQSKEHPGSQPGAEPVAAESIAVSSPYLAAAIHDLLGPSEPLVVLAEPGMCPGHFDLRPSQVRRLRSCRLLVRFDFQSGLDTWLDGDSAKTPRVLAVAVPGGMCEPASYRAVCRQLAEALVDQRRLSPDEARRAAAAIDRRMDELGRWAGERIDAAGLRGAAVLASTHQAGFCRCLGLDVAATFSAADTARPEQIDQAVASGEKSKVRLIVANRPEGRQLADALADRLGAAVVVLDNFPDKPGPEAFDDMVRRNVDSLVRAAKP